MECFRPFIVKFGGRQGFDKLHQFSIGMKPLIVAPVLFKTHVIRTVCMPRNRLQHCNLSGLPHCNLSGLPHCKSFTRP